MHRNSGENNNKAMMTKEKVDQLRRERKETGLSYPKLAKKYGISTSQAHGICVGKYWKEDE
jgi:predicted transcriptional regulator